MPDQAEYRALIDELDAIEDLTPGIEFYERSLAVNEKLVAFAASKGWDTALYRQGVEWDRCKLAELRAQAA